MTPELTIVHLDPDGIPRRRPTVLRPLEADVVGRFLKELGGTAPEGHPTLGGARVRFEDGSVVAPRLGGVTNRASEAFTLRMRRETGCLTAGLGQRCLNEPERLQGFEGDPRSLQRARSH
jgi:hypothetical protein